MQVTLQFALQQEVQVVTVIVRMSFEFDQVFGAEVAGVPRAMMLILLTVLVPGILLQMLGNVGIEVPFARANLLATAPSAR